MKCPEAVAILDKGMLIVWRYLSMGNRITDIEWENPGREKPFLPIAKDKLIQEFMQTLGYNFMF